MGILKTTVYAPPDVVTVIVAPWPDAAVATPPTPAFVTSAVADAAWYATVVFSGWKLNGAATAGAAGAGANAAEVPPPPPLLHAAKNIALEANNAAGKSDRFVILAPDGGCHVLCDQDKMRSQCRNLGALVRQPDLNCWLTHTCPAFHCPTMDAPRHQTVTGTPKMPSHRVQSGV